MPVQILAALPLALALLAFSLSRPWTDRHLLARHQLTQEGQKRSIPVECPDPDPKDVQDRIGFIPEYAGWNFERPPSQIAVTTTTSADLHVLLPWIYYHRLLGVDTFYIFVEGKLQSPENHSILRSIPGVKLNSPTRRLREKQLERWMAHPEHYNPCQLWKGNWLLDYQYRPCNYQFYIRQALNLEAATSVAKRAGVKWIFHLGVDELIFPGGETQNSLVSTLQSFDESVDLVVLPHYESVVENDNVQDPFTEVTLFKRNPSHLSKRDYRQVLKVGHNNSRYFLSHADGRIAARLQPGLHPRGPHRWSNALKILKNVVADEAVVLHYTYSKFSDLTRMRSLCPDCQAVPKLAGRCFTNEFDSMLRHGRRGRVYILGLLAQAFTAAKTLPDDQLLQWYKNHVVWENRTLVYKLVQRSILVRNHIPQILLQGLREVGLFQETIEAGRQAFEDSQMIQKLEVKEMIRRGHKAGKFMFEMASSNFSKSKQNNEFHSPKQDKLVPEDIVKVQNSVSRSQM